jgi:hypothetical protein
MTRILRALSGRIPLIILIVVGAVITAIAVGSLVRLDIPQLSILVVVALVGVCLYDPQRIMLLALFSTPFIGGLRRIVSGESGHVEADFLILLPYVLVLEALILGFARKQTERTSPRLLHLTAAIVVVFLLSSVASAATSGSLGFDTLFRIAAEVTLLLMAWAVAARGDEGFWDRVRRLLPRVALIPGVYGVIQFFVLPEWDRRWMLAVADQFTSIGAPRPFEVRVFGLSESPGSYAAFIALAIVVGLVNATHSRGVRSAIEWLTVVALVPGLLLSGVRTTLVLVLVCVLVLVLFRTRAWQRILLGGFLVVVTVATQYIISSFGAGSSILTADRYSISSIGTDHSLQARSYLWTTLSNWTSYVIGSPAPSGLDNYIVNVMVQYGLLAALAVTVLLMAALVRAVVLLARRHTSVALVSAALVTVFTIAGSMAGDPSYSLMAIIQFAAVGTVIGAPTRTRPAPSRRIDGVSRRSTPASRKRILTG